MKTFSAVRNITTETTAGRRAGSGKRGATPAGADSEGKKDKIVTGTPYFLKFGEHFPGEIPIFGQMVNYLVDPKRKDHEVHQKFVPKTRKAIFVGYRFAPGGKWKGEYFVVDWNRMKTAESLKDVPIYRVKEMTVPK